jgi:8-amino-7-oxononanoate synthase
MRERAAAPLDFSSALYLGLRHPAEKLSAWDALSLGKPAALEDPPGAKRLAAALASLQGCAAATLLPSTLHLFWDLFGVLAREPLAVLIDAGAYPVARWGAERGRARGLPVEVFPANDAGAAAKLARRALADGRRPLILADGYCPGSDRAPPLADYAAIAHATAGYLVLDDTQVLGLFGRDGGGSVPRAGLRRPELAGAEIVVGASLAKGFGAPLAVLAGGRELVERFERDSLTRVHASPPSAAAIMAGWRALLVNRVCGARLRQLLCERIGQLRAALAAIGLACRGGGFPVQSVALGPGVDSRALYEGLRRGGVETVLQSVGDALTLTFLLRADHAPADIERAVAVLKQLLQEAL